MYKPVLIYYDTPNFQEDTLMYLRKNFTLFTFSYPQHDTEEALQRVEALFAPMGFTFDKNRIELCSNLRVVATPTTAELHIDSEYANKYSYLFNKNYRIAPRNG
jgi:lactate dehydrogenase-like 2-hydroxyacid dehydrogenase